MASFLRGLVMRSNTLAIPTILWENQSLDIKCDYNDPADEYGAPGKARQAFNFRIEGDVSCLVPDGFQAPMNFDVMGLQGVIIPTALYVNSGPQGLQGAIGLQGHFAISSAAATTVDFEVMDAKLTGKAKGYTSYSCKLQRLLDNPFPT